MTHYVAFLGGVNVGGHRVSMERLRAEMRSIGLEDARTFIASGNVIFTSRAVAATLETRIEQRLEEQLGYAVPTFVRTAREVTSTAARDPFGELPATDSHYVLFLRRPPTAGEKQATVDLVTRGTPSSSTAESSTGSSTASSWTRGSSPPRSPRRSVSRPRTAT